MDIRHELKKTIDDLSIQTGIEMIDTMKTAISPPFISDTVKTYVLLQGLRGLMSLMVTVLTGNFKEVAGEDMAKQKAEELRVVFTTDVTTYCGLLLARITSDDVNPLSLEIAMKDALTSFTKLTGKPDVPPELVIIHQLIKDATRLKEELH